MSLAGSSLVTSCSPGTPHLSASVTLHSQQAGVHAADRYQVEPMVTCSLRPRPLFCAIAYSGVQQGQPAGSCTLISMCSYMQLSELDGDLLPAGTG